MCYNIMAIMCSALAFGNLGCDAGMSKNMPHNVKPERGEQNERRYSPEV